MLKERHFEVLQHMRRDARKPFTRISADTGIPVTTIFDYYRKFLKEKIITKQVSLLDYGLLGYHFNSVFVLTSFNFDSIVEFLESETHVNNIFKVGDNQLLFEGVFEELEEKHKFLKALDGQGLTEIHEFKVIEDIQREGFMPFIQE
ncbi:Lrp/AsnC family transcriptional regulator [Nanoarchaeota archaeon]